MNHIKLTGLILIIGCLSRAALAVPGWPAESPGEERPPEMFTVSEEVVTPHTEWAKPLASPPSVLFIVPRWGGREVVELAQRMSMKYTVVFVNRRDGYADVTDEAVRLGFAAERPAQITQRLTAALAKPWDVIVVGNVLFSILPTNVVQMLDAKVRAGTGLFVAGNETDGGFTNFIVGATPQDVPPALAATVPLAALPAFTNSAALPPFTACRLGQGRVVRARHAHQAWGNMAVSPPLSITELTRLPVAYDYYQSLTVKALLFTAGRWSDVVTAGKTRVRVRDAGGHDFSGTGVPPVFAQSGAEMNGRDARSTILPDGQYFRDEWWLDNRGRVLDWHTTTFAVTNAQGIASLTTATPSVAAGQEMELRVKLKQPLAAGETLAVAARDFHQRLLSQTNLAATGQSEFTWRVPTAGCLSLMETVTARLERAGKLAAEQQVTFPVVRPSGTGPGWDDFSFMVWAFVESAPVDPVFQKLRAAGMDKLLTGSWSPPAEHARQAALVAERYDCVAYPYAYYIGHLGNCPPDPIRQHLGAVARNLAPYSCDVFSMGDESQLLGGKPPDFNDPPFNDPWINGSFREYLRKQYPSLDALNAEWNSAFTNWNDVTGITLANATNQNQVARWVDHRRHRETLFTEAFIAGEQGVRAVNPQNRVGFEGQFVTDSFRGYDWAQLCPNVTMFGSYWFTPAEWDIIGSMKRPETYWGFWNGAYLDVSCRRTQGWIAWRCLLHGMNSVWYWVPYLVTDFDLAGAFGIYCPDYRENPVCTPFLEAVREIKNGPGKLLLNAQRVRAPVAIHYSQASVYASTLDNGGFAMLGAPWLVSSGTPQLSIQPAWVNAAWTLKEAGLQPRFVPYNQIETGALKDYRVLILPFSQALSAAECREIRAFVEAGGVLVADVRPGLRDEHGKLQPHGLLDDLFGIERAGTNAPAAPADLKLDFVLGGQAIKGTLPLAQPDPNVRVTTGQALAKAGDTPLFIMRQVGKGQTLLLNYAGNYAPGSYDSFVAPAIHSTPAGDLYRDIAQAYAALGGVEAELSVPGLRGIDIVTWKDGPATYYGFTPDDYSDYAWVLTMPDLPIKATTAAPGYFYDIRTGRFLGEGTEFRTTLKAASALLIARLPYRVARVDVTGPKTAAPGATVSFSICVVPSRSHRREEVVAESIPRETVPPPHVGGYERGAETGSPPRFPGAAGHHVLHIEVTANGQPLAYYAANLNAPNGEANFALPLALNASAGRWVITVRDVASGVTGRWAVRVKHGL